MGIIPTMAFVVPRKGGTWEMRESESTPAGPRARTLVTFRTFDEHALAHAAERARKPLDPSAAREAARRAGAPVALTGLDQAAADLVRGLRRGNRVSETVSRMLIDALGGDAQLTDAEAGAAEWVGATDRRRGEALVDLLGLADALPSNRDGALRFPPLKAVAE